eukprot:6939782-Prymnesium_polylepis.2
MVGDHLGERGHRFSIEPDPGAIAHGDANTLPPVSRRAPHEFLVDLAMSVLAPGTRVHGEHGGLQPSDVNDALDMTCIRCALGGIERHGGQGDR